MLEYLFLVFLPIVVLLIALFHDWRNGSIPDWLTYSGVVMMLLYRLYTGNYLDYVIALLFVVVGMTALILLTKSNIGGGDLKLFVFLSLVVGFPAIGWLIFLASLIAILHSIIVKKKEIIMAPAIALAFAVVIFFMHYNQFTIVLT